MKFKLIALAIISMLTQTTFAAIKTDQPDACPSPNLLQSVGVNMAVRNSKGGWTNANLKNNYNTPQVWSFIVLGGQADNEADAIAKANASLAWINFLIGPAKGNVFNDANRWECLYSADGNQLGYLAIAVTPALDAIPQGLVTYKR